MNNQAEKTLHQALENLRSWKDSFGNQETDSTLSVPDSNVEAILFDLSKRLKGNYPFHHPVYAGQMLKPPHPIAWAAYALAMSINPNNHALDGGPPSSEMEKEVMVKLSTFFGYGDEFLGHLTSSGTIANLEALWVARQSNPGKKIAFSENSHYTHGRMCGVLGVDSQTISVLEDGSFDLNSINPTEIGTIVVTLGTTGLGEVEPLDQILPWAKKHGIRIHIDAAYGGFFRTLKDSGLIDGTSWKLMPEADSIVVDPHKHGLQPYGCGAILFKNPEVGKYYKHDSPYTYFTSEELHLGEISLECSRAGAAAVALWATLECFPLKENEGFGPVLAKCRQAALTGYSLIVESDKLEPYKKPELDILTYFPINSSTNNVSEISALSKKVFEAGMKDQSFYLSLFKVPSSTFTRLHPQFTADEDQVTILRSVLMRPEQADFVEELVKRIESHL
ncbi:MAG: aspartate aminotransferase family protein [Balneolaceae bacterium]|nr:aspartate aminotransferase family protein [Balneolaceae bacterium]MBO6544795.1 aspartate aminotransferase family protein [Balneolaceae bacterium]MBO6646191.1 aspartate aminotransferase family protein [Balneolaceae bacterium]